MIRLEDDKGYPWRSSLTKKARCLCCVRFGGHQIGGCSKGREVQYPLYAREHDCKDFIYNPNPQNELSAYDTFRKLDYEYCNLCVNECDGLCDGKQWIPVKLVNGVCEFFGDKSSICKNAIPMLQYGNKLRNNYCKLPPHLRDKNYSTSWKHMCPIAHKENAQGLKCYKLFKHPEVK